MLEAEAVKVKSRIAQVRARASVSGRTVAEADLKFMLIDAS
jgi:3-hydroxymyristoyl/3-hydroxydecanoyl-(acyl carrier protein) dehydratase